MVKARSMHIVLFNGPPRVGKDTAGHALLRHFPDAEVIKMAAPLKAATHALYCVHVGIDHYEANKDEPRPEFFGLSARRAYIGLSEGVVKPAYGEDFFGCVAANRIQHMQQAGVPLVGVTDSGFAEEAMPLLARFGAENILLMRLHREGCSFVGDSRSYLGLPVTTIDVWNKGTVPEFHAAIVNAIEDWRTTWKEKTGA
jgi:hypothetical protein